MGLTVATLRLQLAALLVSDLGNFPNGVPAIWVIPPEPPGLAEGIQCLIQRVPNAQVKQLNAGQRFSDRTFVITLTSLDKAISIASAIERIIQRFNVQRYTYIPLTEQTFEQARVLICDPVVINGV